MSIPIVIAITNISKSIFQCIDLLLERNICIYNNTHMILDSNEGTFHMLMVELFLKFFHTVPKIPDSIIRSRFHCN